MQEYYYIDRDNFLEAIAQLDPFNSVGMTAKRYFELLTIAERTASKPLDYNVDSATWR